MLLRKNRKKLRNQKKESRCHKMKKLAEVVNKSVSMEKNSIEKMCSCESDVAKDLSSSGATDTLNAA